jgi:hypothetical protein
MDFSATAFRTPDLLNQQAWRANGGRRTILVLLSLFSEHYGGQVVIIRLR